MTSQLFLRHVPLIKSCHYVTLQGDQLLFYHFTFDVLSQPLVRELMRCVRCVFAVERLKLPIRA